MTLEPVSKEEAMYVLKRNKYANIVVVNKHHNKKKKRYLEMTKLSRKYLMEYRRKRNENIIEKYGWFTEEYIDKYGNKKTREVFYE